VLLVPNGNAEVASNALGQRGRRALADWVAAGGRFVGWRGGAVATGSAADAFLGTQGDPWDTQEDMATAAIGALTALLFFSRWHDRLISRMETKKAASQAAG